MDKSKIEDVRQFSVGGDGPDPGPDGGDPNPPPDMPEPSGGDDPDDG